MALLTNTSPTLLDLSRALGPDREKVAAVIEILAEHNPLLQDAPMVEGNLTYGMQYNVRRFLPQGTWRQLYEGVKPTKSGRDQVPTQAARLEAYAQVDSAMPGDLAGLRADEIRAHVEGMSQQIATAAFYGDNRVDPAQFNGLSMYYNDKSAENGQNIVDAGGMGNDNRSIWLIGWGPEKVTFFHPKARTGYDVPTGALGVQHEDKGRVTTEVIDGTASGGLAEVYRDHLVAELGLCVKDWRWAVRIPNIDLSDLNREHSGSSAYLEELVVRGLHRIGGTSQMKGSVVGYADRELLAWLHRQALADKRQFIPFNQLGGTTATEQALMWNVAGINIKPMDALNVNEARVT